MTYSNAAHLCEVVVDIETGLVTPVRYLVAEDCGTMLNPMIVAGQQHGAVAFGLGGALREQVVFDEHGHNLTGSFMDYAMSTATDFPGLEIVGCHTPSLRTPTGSKGMSEGSVMGAIGAVTLAVNDALALLRVRVKRQSMSPMAIHALLRAANAHI